MGMHAFLKNILRLTNSLLLVLGLFMGLFSLYLMLQFRKERRASEAGGVLRARAQLVVASPPTPPRVCNSTRPGGTR